MIDLQTISMDPLEGLTVADVTETDVPTIDENWELEEVLHLLVDSPFYRLSQKIGFSKESLQEKSCLKP